MTSAADDSRFHLAMKWAGIGMAVVSTDGRWMEVNPALCKLFGHSAEALIGTPVWDLSHPDDLPLSVRLRDSLLSGQQESVDVEKRYLHADGRVMEVEVNTALMRDAQGNADYFISQFRDVTSQRHTERALQDLNNSLEARVQARTREVDTANRRMESFVHGVSHDLRAPLRAIDGFANQLVRNTDGVLDAQSLGHLQRIRAATTRMASLLDSLLELARVNRSQLRLTKVDVSLLAEWVLAELQDADPQRAADVQVGPGLEVIGDERMLKTMLTELLKNAWHFSATKPHVRIQVRGERMDNTLQLDIQDEGIGFDMAYAGKLYEPFERLHGIDEGAGNGIGLTIAQQIAMRHCGKIHAQAELGRGACFHVELQDQDTQETQN
ncbi:MAG: PAS domain S-box protein [Thermomonas sp.]